jgi:hypothetical protein
MSNPLLNRNLNLGWQRRCVVPVAFVMICRLAASERPEGDYDCD